jgi:starch phosphorylase
VADDATSLYEKLEHAVVPGYYGQRRAWIAIMKGAIAKCSSLFNSHRMMHRYGVEAYLE